MRRPPILAAAVLALTGAMTLAGATEAQAQVQTADQTPGQSAGLRYLSWQGRGPVTTLATAAHAGVTPARRVRRDLRRPNTVIPHGGFEAAAPTAPRPGLTPAPGGRTDGLTPATAWLRPAVPPPEAQPAPIAAAASEPAPGLAPPPPPPVRALPDYLPERGGQATPAAIVQPAPAPAAARNDAFDPMAPRRDAPIFHLQRPSPPAAAQAAPEAASATAAHADAAPPPAGRPEPHRIAQVVNTGEQPPVQGARYYSVHRLHGQRPDPLMMPDPTYVDALAVTLAETPATQDLAAPEQGPTLIRDNQGRLRAAPAASDGDHQ